MKKFKLHPIGILLIPFLFSAGLFLLSTIHAGASAGGTFKAEKACQAYISKKKLTNPDRAEVSPGIGYRIIEINKAAKPEWYRIYLQGATPPERWVTGSCGTAHVQTGRELNSADSSMPAQCDKADEADGYVLALSWLPAFCESHEQKPECNTDTQVLYGSSNFTLHGLWPNRTSCGIDYGYCGEVKKKPRNFCDYPPVALGDGVREKLAEVMPASASGSCLERHEWHKHGTCQSKWSADEYYEKAISLARQFNESGMAAFMKSNVGSEVKEKVFLKKIDYFLGAGVSNRMKLTCRNGALVDVYIKLPEDIDREEVLGKLILQGRTGYSSNCGASFFIDAMGQ